MPDMSISEDTFRDAARCSIAWVTLFTLLLAYQVGFAAGLEWRQSKAGQPLNAAAAGQHLPGRNACLWLHPPPLQGVLKIRLFMAAKAAKRRFERATDPGCAPGCRCLLLGDASSKDASCPTQLQPPNTWC
jgi:hypothetical protein